ncbi:MAG: DUF427 domain-containing protein [Cyanobacteria bacterium REEB459]|nr:DUF427 domain-containing protein [Cyanobacteria bacterium REEB459]
MARVIWNDVVLAASDACEVVEGNLYFPPESLHQEYFHPVTKTTVCGWKGTANYYDIVVNGQARSAAAWYYPDPKPAAKNIKGYVAFYRNQVQIES